VKKGYTTRIITVLPLQFRFVYHHDFMGPSGSDPDDLELMSAFAKYSEPFNAECRAFGRLRDEGYEDLALPCFGYLLLDEQHERQMMDRFSDLELTFNGNPDNMVPDDIRGNHLGRDGRPPPIRGIVKELGQGYEPLRTKGARRLLRDIIQLQQLGIIYLDVAFRQLVNGRFADFSTAVTTPHFLTSPELNPLLTPEWISAMEFELFQYSISDFWDFDNMVRYWNEDHGDTISVFAFPRGHGLKIKYGLRNSPTRERIYSLVNPRSFDWKRAASTAAATSAESGPTPTARGRTRPASTISKPRRRLAARPARWYYHCEGKNAETLKSSVTLTPSIDWEFKEGFIFPSHNRY